MHKKKRQFQRNFCIGTKTSFCILCNASGKRIHCNYSYDSLVVAANVPIINMCRPHFQIQKYPHILFPKLPLLFYSTVWIYVNFFFHYNHKKYMWIFKTSHGIFFRVIWHVKCNKQGYFMRRICRYRIVSSHYFIK